MMETVTKIELTDSSGCLLQLQQHPRSPRAHSVSRNLSSDCDGLENQIDFQSIKGVFGWAAIDDVNVPYILRAEKQFVSVRIVKLKLLDRYIRSPSDLSKHGSFSGFYITNNEAKLLNEINLLHCDGEYGKEKFDTKELIVLLSDFIKCYYLVKESFLGADSVGTKAIDRALDNTHSTQASYLCQLKSGQPCSFQQGSQMSSRKVEQSGLGHISSVITDQANRQLNCLNKLDSNTKRDKCPPAQLMAGSSAEKLHFEIININQTSVPNIEPIPATVLAVSSVPKTEPIPATVLAVLSVPKTEPIPATVLAVLSVPKTEPIPATVLAVSSVPKTEPISATVLAVSSVPKTEPIPATIMAVSSVSIKDVWFNNKTISCLSVSQAEERNEPFCLVEAVCKLYFNECNVNEFLFALENVLNVSLRTCNDTEEKAFIQYYSLSVVALKCNKMIKLKDVYKYFQQLTYMFPGKKAIARSNTGTPPSEPHFVENSAGADVNVRTEREDIAAGTTAQVSVIQRPDKFHTLVNTKAGTKKNDKKCPKCDFVTHSYRKYFYHQVARHEARHNIPVYSCTDCDFRSVYQHHVTLHRSKAHQRNIADQCKGERNCSSKQYRLSRHQNLHGKDLGPPD